MRLRISSELHHQLLATAAASPEVEICGLLIGQGTIERIVPTTNVATDRQSSFEIDPEALFNALRSEREGRDRLLGYYHSHPVGPPQPSAYDTAQAANDSRIWFIIGDGQVTAWQMSDVGMFKPMQYEIYP